MIKLNGQCEHGVPGARGCKQCEERAAQPEIERGKNKVHCVHCGIEIFPVCKTCLDESGLPIAALKKGRITSELADGTALAKESMACGYHPCQYCKDHTCIRDVGFCVWHKEYITCVVSNK